MNIYQNRADLNAKYIPLIAEVAGDFDATARLEARYKAEYNEFSLNSHYKRYWLEAVDKANDMAEIAAPLLELESVANGVWEVAHAGREYLAALPLGNAPIGLQTMIEAYEIALLWSETDGEEPLDENYSRSDFSQPARDRIAVDCWNFLRLCGELVGSQFEQAGHDFALTRNGHGSGFWDRPEIWGEVGSKALSAVSEAFGSADLYVGDDGKVWQFTAETFEASAHVRNAVSRGSYLSA